MRQLSILLLALWSSVASAQEYVVGVGDAIMVHVHGEDGLTRTHQVPPTCAIEVGLIGVVQVCGRPTGSIAEDIRGRLAADYLRNPQVSVEVASYGSQRVQVMGEVRTPGEIVLQGPTTLVEAIVRAGDRKTENVVEVELVRGDQITSFNLLALPVSEPIWLKSGDIVVLKQARYVYVTGGVRQDGPVVYRSGMTVTQALSSAGGESEFGRLGKAYIKRADGTRVQVNMKRVLAGKAPDMELEPDDQLVIPGA